MTPIADILVPYSESKSARRIAAWLAAHLGARVHELRASDAASIVEASREYGAGLIVMEAHQNAGDSTSALGRSVRDVIEHSQCPVLLLPDAYEENTPWRSVLVPLSGEIATDESLGLALKLAAALELKVTVAHVAEDDSGAGRERGKYADTGHHEAPQALNEMIANACARCTTRERQRIEAFHLIRGRVTDELLRLLGECRFSLMVVGWHGEFMVGHAQVLKGMLPELHCPVLLVRPTQQAPFRLKVAELF